MTTHARGDARGVDARQAVSHSSWMREAKAKTMRFGMNAFDPSASMPYALTPEELLGCWADSLGHSVSVYSTDAFEVRLTAKLSQPGRPDVFLRVRPIPGGGWSCGNAVLDPVWSSTSQLHWLAADGRISVWMRTLAGTDGSYTGGGWEA
mmetsp:Transcript_13570/g.29860  ORF Transcript_13570/g.29860 Transcript_13570/m.29860 type:complete len:150 (-) Transcript_13570:228-677(-)|eukprot:CAMPEP_0170643044 /NCGR_PEP_ID=MMETSP0224-20130122/41664_1 /TAXON_ID=285029 /ORGANISM="Togula jolla, Strain CCCM 725" /LENGTH=149 /DNA_ID=CAMNT_0010973823 /DNA_START=60 /DNA_END=509 /DNA_ORIENTATION=-